MVPDLFFLKSTTSEQGLPLLLIYGKCYWVTN